MIDPWHIETIEITVRLLTSLFLGGIIGYEREINRHAAGLRTNILVCVGSTLIMLLSIYGFNQFLNESSVRSDPARLAAQVISGIGFLGAGTIMQRGASIKGLTTAATLWVMAAIGLAVGAGFYYPAVITCVIVFLSLRILNKVEHRFFSSGKLLTLRIQIPLESQSISEVYACLSRYNVSINNINIVNEVDDGAAFQWVKVTFESPKDITWLILLEKIQSIPDVSIVHMER